MSLIARMAAAIIAAHAIGADEWACLRCGAAYFGPVPDDGLCAACRAGGSR